MELANLFHPAVVRWFEAEFAVPTPVQSQTWPAIGGGEDTLMAAPTGSGKTLAAFLAIIDQLVRESLEQGLADETRVLYVSPLKALSNDVQKNLQQPLAGIQELIEQDGATMDPIRAWVRTGDTPQAERARMVRRPPHILVTTPESLYILLTSDSGRRMLSTVRTVIVDELHAVAGNKRGSHLSLSLERLTRVCGRRPQRVGISATQKPIDTMAGFLTGRTEHPCTIVDTGHTRERDLQIVVPPSPLTPVMANEVWAEVYDQLADLIAAHRTTLVFVNTRRLAERAARHLAERIGEDYVTSHHGSLARKHRLRAEQKLKAGELKALVATASLELGIDIGDVDLVCQLGSPHGINPFLQRVGRSGHGVDAMPKGRLFPLTRDDLVQSSAIMDATLRNELDAICVPNGPLDVLAQQVIAEVSLEPANIDELRDQFASAFPYRDLDPQVFDDLVRVLSQGFTTRRGRRGAYLHLDSSQRQLRGKRAARLTAITNGGAIPDQFDYDVVLSPEDIPIGTLTEDFAFESLPGDIFQLGNTAYRILRVDTGRVYVADAQGQPPTIPFWVGEAPGRSDELSHAVSRVRAEIDSALRSQPPSHVAAIAEDRYRLCASGAGQLIEYLAQSRAALDGLPHHGRIVLERFFDEGGDTHLVVHSSFGSRINRAWGLALRKKFCRRFNFELQAAALEDTLVLSLGATHSFVLEEVMDYLKVESLRHVLTQALLGAPVFPTHWRFNVTTALAVRRFANGRKRPAQFQRNDAEDLLALVFPDQLACAENLAGEREVPDHPLVQQTIDDCVTQVMDVDGLEAVLTGIKAGQIEVVARELATPSPLAQEVLSARPYAFLDDAPAEERRTLAIQSRRFASVEEAGEIGELDPAAVARVVEEAWPQARDADEVYDALAVVGFVTATEAERHGWVETLGELAADRRAAIVYVDGADALWVAAERMAEFMALGSTWLSQPLVVLPPGVVAAREAALVELLRSRLEALGPVTAAELGAPLSLSDADVGYALAALESEGFAMQGHFGRKDVTEWCERRLLARIHRYTLKRLRAAVEPVPLAQYQRFLLRWQGVDADPQEGLNALARTVDQLQGFPVAASAWERDVLPARIHGFSAALMDQYCATGRLVWRRAGSVAGARVPVGATPIALFPRGDGFHWSRAEKNGAGSSDELSDIAYGVWELLSNQGALFFVDIVEGAGLTLEETERALSELVAAGLITADGFMGLRLLLRKKPKRRRRRRGGAELGGLDVAGRWAPIVPGGPSTEEQLMAAMEHVAWSLLRRYGVVFRRVLQREPNLPSWRALLQQFHRLEARGEIRAGRFIAGQTGEQFALPDAVPVLRSMAKRGSEDRLVEISAADPLNLVGILTEAPRLPAVAGHRLLLRDGLPVAALTAMGVEWLDPALSAQDKARMRQRLTPREPFTVVAAT